MYAGVKLLPEHVFSLPGDPDVSSAAFSLDGASVYILAHYDSLHIGQLLDATLAIWLACLCVPFLLWGVIRAIKALRRPRDPGKRYCPKCNYCVTHDTGTLTTCSECGQDLAKRPPVLGKTVRRRVLTNFATLIAPPIFVYTLALLVVYFFGIFRHFNWHSITIGEILKAHSTTLHWRWGQDFSQIIYRADIATGRIDRIEHLSGATFRQISVHPITGDIALEADNNHISLINPVTGDIRRRLDLHYLDHSSLDTHMLLDVSPDGQTVFTEWQRWDPTAGHSVFASWRLTDRNAVNLARNDPADGAPTNTYERTFITKGDANRRFVFAVPSFSEIFQSKSYLLHVYDLAQNGKTYQRTHSINLGPDFNPEQPSLISLRENALILTTTAFQERRSDLIAFDLDALQRGEAIRRWTIGLAQPPGSVVALTPDESTIYAATTGGIAEIDIAQRGMQRLLAPGDTHFQPRAVAASATHVLVESSRPVGPRDVFGHYASFTSDIFIWRVR
jgi:hypothetical protein